MALWIFGWGVFSGSSPQTVVMSLHSRVTFRVRGSYLKKAAPWCAECVELAK